MRSYHTDLFSSLLPTPEAVVQKRLALVLTMFVCLFVFSALWCSDILEPVDQGRDCPSENWLIPRGHKLLAWTEYPSSIRLLQSGALPPALHTLGASQLGTIPTAQSPPKNYSNDPILNSLSLPTLPSHSFLWKPQQSVWPMLSPRSLCLLTYPQGFLWDTACPSSWNCNTVFNNNLILLCWPHPTQMIIKPTF